MRMTKNQYKIWLKSLMSKDSLTVTEISHLYSPGFSTESKIKRKEMVDKLMSEIECGNLKCEGLNDRRA